MGKTGKFFSLTGLERCLLTEAVFWCGLTRMIMLAVPFRNYHRLLGNPHDKNSMSSGFPVEKNRKELIVQIGKAVGRASRNVPWHTRCFVEASATKRMLKRRHIPCTVFLGLKKTKTVEDDPHKGDLKAHAWTVSGDITVSGSQGVRLNEYTVVSTFK